jgi:hypothetical protein
VDVLTFLCCWSGEGGKNGIALVKVMEMSAVIALKGVQIPPLGECAWLAIIINHMMVAVAPAAQARARQGTRVQMRS